MFQILKRQWLRDLLLGAGLLLFGAGLVAAPGEAIAGAKEGLGLCGNVIVPSLFPFFVLSALAVDLGLAACLGRAMERVMRPLFRVNGCCAAAVVMGFVGGYPVGARTALGLYQQGLCSRDEAERLLAFCNNSGPAFILGVVGAGVFGSGRVGLLLYLTHALSSLLVGLLFRFHGAPPGRAGAPGGAARPQFKAVRAGAAFTDAVGKALQSTLNICAFVVFFSVMLRLLAAFGVLSAAARLLGLFGVGPEWARRLVAGLLELSSGVASLAGAGAGGVPMAAFMLGWAGLSVHCQVLSFLADSGLGVRTYLLGKLCHGAIAAALTWAFTRLFPLDAPVSAYLADQARSIAGADFSSALAISTASAFALWAVLTAVCARVVKKSCGKSALPGL